MSSILAVVGTDTGVGKTVVSSGLLYGLGRAGYRVAGWKAVETGIPLPGEGALSDLADWQRLEQASCQAAGTALGQSFPLPAAPLAAARASGKTLSLTLMEDQRRHLLADHDLVILEGAGGLLVPLADGLLWGDLLARWAPRCLLVGRLGLGGINHCLLTLEAMRQRGLDPLGVVLCATTEPTAETGATPDLVAVFGNIHVFDTIPHGTVEPREVADRLRRCGLLGLLGSHPPPSGADPLF